MSLLGKLKIGAIAKAFAPFKSKHNALVEAIEGMEGRGGIKVVISEGKIIISPGAQGPIPTTGGGAGGGGGSTIATELHFNNGTVQIDIGPLDGIFFQYIPNGNTVEVTPTGGLIVTDGTTGFEIDLGTSAITHNMGIQTIDVCDAGVAKSMLVIGSATF